MEQHSLVTLIVVLLCHLPPPVTVSLPQFGVPVQLRSVTSFLCSTQYTLYDGKNDAPDLLYLNDVVG